MPRNSIYQWTPLFWNGISGSNFWPWLQWRHWAGIIVSLSIPFVSLLVCLMYCLPICPGSICYTRYKLFWHFLFLYTLCFLVQILSFPVLNRAHLPVELSSFFFKLYLTTSCDISLSCLQGLSFQPFSTWKPYPLCKDHFSGLSSLFSYLFQVVKWFIFFASKEHCSYLCCRIYHIILVSFPSLQD